jgi:uncharacterized protein (DUF2147 family)
VRDVLLAAFFCLLAPSLGMAQSPTAPGVQPSIPEGVWLLEGKAAVEILDCSGSMCGRILWLRIPRNPQGELVRDKKNPDPSLRLRPLCGLTVIGDLRPDGPGRWKDGWLYNPDEGVKYRITARLVSNDVIVARAYLLLPLFGKTLTLARVPHGRSEGWC